MRLSTLVVALSLFPALASSQSMRDIISQQLDAASEAIADEGFRPSAGVIAQNSLVGLLPAGGRVFLELNLRAGTDYMVVGGCDYDCSDLDLSAYSADGTQLAADVEMDDAPVVSFRTETSGMHIVEVTMPGCGTETCYFGIRVFND